MNQAGYERGLELFDAGDFFDAHEVLEDVWRAAPAEEKRFLQGLIQLAVGLHHHSRGNLAGARSLLARGNRNLSGYPEGHGGINLPRLRSRVAEWVRALEDNGPTPAAPRLRG